MEPKTFYDLCFQDKLEVLFSQGDHIIRLDDVSDLYILHDHLIIAYRNIARDISHFYLYPNIVRES